MTLAQLISSYGYAAILVGTFLEGETILVLGGFAAHQGYLRLAGVILAAFIGSLTGDQLFFIIGRRYGHRFLARRPQWRQRTARVHALLERNQSWLIVSFRFFYGLRTITPFALGTSKVPGYRFLMLNTFGALLWAVSFGTAGYLFGAAVKRLVTRTEHYEVMIMGGIAAAGFLLWLGRRLRGRARGNVREP